MAHRLSNITGISPKIAERLGEAGIVTTADFLEAAARPKGRAALAAKATVSEALVLRWANRADLMRISGISGQIGDLLEAAGVATVPELKRQRPDELAEALKQANDKRQLARRVPGRTQCARFIDAAKALPRVLSY